MDTIAIGRLDVLLVESPLIVVSVVEPVPPVVEPVFVVESLPTGSVPVPPAPPVVVP